MNTKNDWTVKFQYNSQLAWNLRNLVPLDNKVADNFVIAIISIDPASEKKNGYL